MMKPPELGVPQSLIATQSLLKRLAKFLTEETGRVDAALMSSEHLYY